MRNKSSSPYMGFSFKAAVFLIAFAFFNFASVAQTIKRRGVMWVAPTSETLWLNGYEVKEESDSDGIGREYIRRAEDRRWIPFYTRERYVLVTLGHRRHLVLVNDCPATKLCKVKVVNLFSGESKQIDTSATKTYKRNASPDEHLVIIPQAYAFSPDDRKVLIHLELIYISVPAEQRDLANRLNRSYKNWRYVVDSASGRVLREYRTSTLPRKWWT